MARRKTLPNDKWDLEKQDKATQKTAETNVDVYDDCGGRGGFDARNALAGRLDETTVRQAAGDAS